MIDTSTLRLFLRFWDRVGLAAVLLLLMGAVYLGYIPSPLLAKLEAHDKSVDETVRIARLQCAFLARLARMDGTPCFNVDISRGTPQEAQSTLRSLQGGS